MGYRAHLHSAVRRDVLFVVAGCSLPLFFAFSLAGCGTTPSVSPTGTIPEYDNTWKALISGSSCSETPLKPKGDDKVTGTLVCTSEGATRHYKFPVGKFDIDEQVVVPSNTVIEGSANPNDPSDKAKKPNPNTQTYFVATHGVSDVNVAYCGTNGNMQPGDAQRLRIGFLLNSHTTVKNINFQGKDAIRPDDNSNLCGGGVFETPGCVSPGFGDGTGDGWESKRNGCYDHTGKQNDLIIGDGKGVENIIIDSVRINDLLLPSVPSEYKQGAGSQVAVWIAMTQDGSPTTNIRITNLVSMLSRADGINLHGNVQDSLVENCHIENTGDDIYAFWGAYAEHPAGNVFRNNVGKNPGVTRDYMYGTCVAVYGALDVTIVGTKCYDLGKSAWNPGQVPSGNPSCQHGAYCNSCLAYVHDGWFGAEYPDGNVVKIHGSEYFYADEAGTPIPASDRPLIRSDPKSKANIVTDFVSTVVL